jgi:chromate transporter
VAVGQVTPGPVFSTATFVGWQIHGASGAAAATVGIFLPTFVLVAFLGRIVDWTRDRAWARSFLEGVTAASLGLMAGVLVRVTSTAIIGGFTALLALVALGVLVRMKVNSAWLVAFGILIGVAHAVIV